MTEPTVYLAGPIRHAPDDGRRWRNYLQDHHGDDFDFLDPLDLDDDLDVPDDGPVSLDVVPADLDLIDAADAVLAWLPIHKVSRGTACEIWEADRHMDTPVVVWGDADGDQYSPFVRDPATAIVRKPDVALQAVEAVADGWPLSPDWTDFDGGDA